MTTELIAGLRLTPSLIDLIQTTIAAVAALVGVWLGSMWNTRTEGRRWQRDQRTAAYVAFLREIEALRVFVVQYDVEELDQKARDKQALVKLFRPAAIAKAGLRLYGNNRVNSSSDRALDLVIKFAGARSDKRDALHAQAWRAIDELVEACRADLRIPPLGQRIRGQQGLAERVQGIVR